MRIAERLARLESRAGQAQPGMTSAEIDAAAVVYEQRLREDGVPGGGAIDAALAGWRKLVERAAPSMQPIWANIEPMDLFA